MADPEKPDVDPRIALRAACLERARAVILSQPLPPWLREDAQRREIEQ